MPASAAAPQAEIRRFDIFAEWNRRKAEEKLHLPAEEARAYGLAVAKVVAARKFSGHAPEQVKDWQRRARHDDTAEPWWQHLGSTEEFHSKIVRRMGEAFYHDVFQPAVAHAWQEGQTYEQIRDTMRASWNESRKVSRTPSAS